MSDLPILENSKPALRRAALACRETLSMTEISRNIAQHLIEWPVFRKSETVLFFYPFRNEIDLVPLVEAFPQKHWYLPKVESAEQMDFYRYTRNASLTSGPYGVLEPSGGEKLDYMEQASLLILLPGLMFDRSGHRLGYGKGYYDRFLSGLKRKNIDFIAVGPVPDVLWVDKLPHDAHDVPMHAVVSESRLITIPERVS